MKSIVSTYTAIQVHGIDSCKNENLISIIRFKTVGKPTNKSQIMHDLGLLLK